MSRDLRRRPPRIAVGGVYHESNSFAEAATELGAFDVHRGSEVISRHNGTSTSIGGFLAAAEGECRVEPLLFAMATPSGEIAANAEKVLLDEIEEALAGRKFDVVLLGLHGSAVGQEHHDFDGELVERVRTVAGDSTLIGLSLDMHANISERTIEMSDVATLYRTNPHLDAAHRAMVCARICFEAARSGVLPAKRLVNCLY